MSDQNIHYLDGPFGLREFRLVQGDICESDANLIIVSTHFSPVFPQSGAVRSALEKHGVKLKSKQAYKLIEGGEIHLIEAPLRNKMRTFVLVRQAGLHRVSNPADFLNANLESLFATLADLEYSSRKFKRIALPTLFASRLKEGPSIKPEVLLDSIIAAASKWLKHSRFTDCVEFFVYESQKWKHLSGSMDTVLHREFLTQMDLNFVRGLLDEVRSLLNSTQHISLAKAQSILLSSLNSKSRISKEAVGAGARLLAEITTSTILEHYKIKPKRDFNKNLSKLQNEQVIAPWLHSYLVTLQHIGNRCVHPDKPEWQNYKPNSINTNDFFAILVALRAVLDYWQKFLINEGVDGS